MKELIQSLNRLLLEKSRNPYAKFIEKKSIVPEQFKAYKRMTIELYLHIPNKNIKCVAAQVSVNTSNLSENLIWREAETHFCYEVIKWIMSGGFKETIDGLQVE